MFVTAPNAKPVKIQATVKRGYSAVIRAIVSASVEYTNYEPEVIILRDDGVGADTIQDDGIYCGFIVNAKSEGKHSVSVMVRAGKDTAIRATRTGNNAARVRCELHMVY